jgi:hypothetical protein
MTIHENPEQSFAFACAANHFIDWAFDRTTRFTAG